MRSSPVHYTLSLLKHTWARVYLNQLPVYTRPYRGPDSVCASVNELLVPGENEVAIELLDTYRPASGEPYRDAIRFQLFELVSVEPFETREIFDLRYPGIMLEAAERFRRLPLHYRRTFDPGVLVVEPPWMSAAETDFGCEGTAELRAAVARLHRALVEGDAEAFLDEISLKLSHGARAFPQDPDETVAAKRVVFREALFDGPLAVAPLDLDGLHFRPLHRGRVAYVNRYDGTPALSARRRDDPEVGLETDLLMTTQQGRWLAFA
jgi:hypothetical protein